MLQVYEILVAQPHCPMLNGFFCLKDNLLMGINFLLIVYYIHFREDPIKWNGSTLYFRGAKILEVVMDAILTAGGDKIEHVILTGCSGTTLLYA